MITALTPAEFFAAAQAAYEAAASHVVSSRKYVFGPVRLEIRSPSPDLQAMFERALDGTSDGRPCNGRILAWEGEFCPPPPGGLAYTRRGDLPHLADERFLSAYNVAARLLCLYDRERRLGLYWTPSARALPGWERTAPLRALLHWHGLEMGLQLTHGAVVGSVLLAGKGGSGKSTTALACLQTGQPYLCDDYCLLDARATAYRVYANARVLPQSMAWLPRLAELPRQPSDEKLALRVAAGLEQARPRAILLPRLGSPLALSPASREDCLKALALTTMAQLPGAGPASFRILESIASSLPAHHLTLGPDPAAAAALLKERF